MSNENGMTGLISQVLEGHHEALAWGVDPDGCECGDGTDWAIHVGRLIAEKVIPAVVEAIENGDDCIPPECCMDVAIRSVETLA